MKEIKNKLLRSVHFEFLLNSVKNGKEAAEIHRELNEDKSYPISLPTVRDAVRFIKKNGEKAVSLLAESKKEIVEIADDIQKIAPMLTNTLKRRTVLLKEILQRKEELLKATKEGERVEKLRKMLEELKTTYLETEDKSIVEQQIRNIDAYVVSNFANNLIRASLESLIRQYIMDSHEIFKYCENWTSKYDIYNLIEKVVTQVSEASMFVFGNFIKRETQEQRDYLIKRYKEEVQNVLKEVEQELKLGEEEQYDEKK
ncbi:MAG: hypothetical protein NC222_06590 [Staphylococcus sp.]|nr:hypothetical protein [Staphylococcus sp.]